MNARELKTAYIVPAFLAMVCAIVAAYFHQVYIALGFIVVAAILIVAGSMLVAEKLKKERLKK